MADSTGAPAGHAMEDAQQQQLQQQQGVQALEEHFYIRFPPDLAESIRDDLRAIRKPSDLSITFTTARTATVQIGADEQLPAVLVDLPTVTETLKSLDPGSGPATTGQYCKVASVSPHMLIVCGGEEGARRLEEEMRARDWQWGDGLTLPMHRARQRRFRTDATRRRRAEIEEIEEQVRHLLERDEASEENVFEYYVGGRLINSSDGLGGGLAMSQQPHTAASMDAEAAVFAAQIEDELLAELAGDMEEIIDADEDNILLDDTRLERLRELEAKRSQLERVTNPTIRAFLEETIRQLESELQD